MISEDDKKNISDVSTEADDIANMNDVLVEAV